MTKLSRRLLTCQEMATLPLAMTTQVYTNPVIARSDSDVAISSPYTTSEVIASLPLLVMTVRNHTYSFNHFLRTTNCSAVGLGRLSIW